jgi:DNA processing protein
LTLKDENYPQLLKEIKNPPFVLYGRGNREILSDSFCSLNDSLKPDGNTRVAQERATNNTAVKLNYSGMRRTVKSAFREKTRLDNYSSNTIAIVGARKTTQYGREVTKLLASELALAGFTIVSGLALGVDAVSHMTALENSGKTIAVLGCGVDCCNPGENQNIYDEILKSGNCIVSEFPLGMRPTLWSFPARNRIIAGLSQAVLVTEGAEDSGSLITAEFALKFSRQVFAVPGPITSSMSKEPYKLISRGAKLVTTADDILKELKAQNSNVKTKTQISKRKGETKEEDLIIKLLENEPLHFDEIVRRTKLKSSNLSSILSMMEIKGLINSASGGFWQI